MVKIIITPELTEWLVDRLGLTPDEALTFANEFAGLLYLTGAITPPPDDPWECPEGRTSAAAAEAPPDAASVQARWG